MKIIKAKREREESEILHIRAVGNKGLAVLWKRAKTVGILSVNFDHSYIRKNELDIFSRMFKVEIS